MDEGRSYHPQADAEFIDLIYAALLGETSWQTFLDRLSANAPDGRTVLFSHNMSQADEYLAMASCFEGPELAAYAAHYVNLNPWLQHCAARKVGLGIHSDEIISHAQMLQTEFYNDFLAPNGIARSIGVTIDKFGECPLIISTVTSRPDPEMNARFSEQLTRIAPHLQRVARFYRNSPSRWTGFDLGVSLFDSLDVGVVVLGESGVVRTISRTGQQLINGAPVTVSPLGKLRLHEEDAQSVLQQMLKRSYEGPKTASLFSGGMRLTLISVEKDRLSLLFEGPTVAILIQPQGVAGNAVDLDQFAGAYALTKGERRAVLGIVEGKSVTEIAAEAGLSRETIRTQLKSVYAKTATGGQADLLRLVHGFPPFPQSNRN